MYIINKIVDIDRIKKWEISASEDFYNQKCDEIQNKMDKFIHENREKPDIVYLDVLTYKRLEVYLYDSYYFGFSQDNFPRFRGIEVRTLPVSGEIVLFAFYENDKNLGYVLNGGEQ